MPKAVGTGIISHARGIHEHKPVNAGLPKRDWWLVAILVLASFLRFWRIGEFTEFLGDQGRTMLVLYDFVKHGIVPLVGPPLIAGQHLGPFFYYLIVPPYAIFGTPLAVACWMAVLGVCSVIVLYLLVRDMTGVYPARLAALLWAVSPGIVTGDRVIWEPNLVPLFTLLYFYALFKAHRLRKLLWWLAVGAVIGILLQFHYPNTLFIMLTGVYFFVSIAERKMTLRDAFGAIVSAAFGFIAVMFPFLLYERTVGFRDIREIFSIFTVSAGTPVGKRVLLLNAIDFNMRVWLRAIPFLTKPTAAVLSVLWGLYVLRFRTRRNIFISLWAAGGIIGMSLYRNVVFDHYLFMITAVPFLILSIVVSSCKGRIPRILIGIAVLFVALSALAKSDEWTPGPRDLERTERAVSVMAARAGTTPYSFTVIQSRSFSDMHYRYFFRAHGSFPVSVLREDYPLLFLACDQASCPDSREVRARYFQQILCYEPKCAQFYSTININDKWTFIREEPVAVNGRTEGRIYEFRRK